MSQCLEDSPPRWGAPKPGPQLNLQEVYDERHRLALEELLSGGVAHFQAFLRRERIPSFLSDDELQRIAASAAPPRRVSVLGDDAAPDAVSTSVDCSSVTYFPDVSDVEPPVLDIGWPAFTSGSYRGVTRAVAYFQPSYEESIYSCKEAVRRLIKSAREVIAIVTDSLTDLDIFRDLQEACSARKVPVYVLLDQASAPAFLKMCANVSVHLDDLQQMRVRTISGTTYCMRSGARITGKVHERFMLIDGTKVATGSYRFNWTDGKLNSSNLVELSGQIAEKFDEEFRILYATSQPVNAWSAPSARNSGIFEHHLGKHQGVSSPRLLDARLTSTPNRKAQSPGTPAAAERKVGGKSGPASNSSTIGGDRAEEEVEEEEEILAGISKQPPPLDASFIEPEAPPPFSRHISTQTSQSLASTDTQTEPGSDPDIPQHPDLTATATSRDHVPPEPHRASPESGAPNQASDCPPPGQVAPDSGPMDSLHKLTRERQRRYAAIHTKLEHMMAVLSQRQEVVGNISSVTEAWRARMADAGGRAAAAEAHAGC